MKRGLRSTRFTMFRTNLYSKVYSQILALALIAVIATTPVSAQMNFLDPLNVTNVFGGVQFNNNGFSIQPPHPERVPQFIQSLPSQVGLSLLNPFGSVLAQQIRAARDNVRNQGCQPVPDAVMNRLAPFMPASVADGVCWAVLRPGLTLDNAVMNIGDAGAVTLDDTIVFSPGDSALMVALWAHELTHVMQYRRLSVEGFANIYTYDSGRLEGEAYGFENFVRQRLSDPNAMQQQYYQSPNAWNVNNGMTPATWASQARAAIDPSTCIDARKTQGGGPSQVVNDCPIAVVVLNRLYTNPAGQVVQIDCLGNCVVAPGTSLFFNTPPGLEPYRVNMRWL